MTEAGELEAVVLPGGVPVTTSAALRAEGFRVAFTERGGGASEGLFRGLNLGLRSGDDVDVVLENRRRAARALGVERFACVWQVHGARCREVGPAEAGAGFDDPRGAVDAADALLTRSPGVALAVLTADCVPVALADPASGTLAVVHAGWRGIVAGVLQAALDRFPDARGVRAAIGPAVGPDHYEVGEEVAVAVRRATDGLAAIGRSDGTIRLDLPATVARVLEQWGVRSVDRSGECTACLPDRYFSYRRDGATGRQAVIAVRG